MGARLRARSAGSAWASAAPGQTDKTSEIFLFSCEIKIRTDAVNNPGRRLMIHVCDIYVWRVAFMFGENAFMFGENAFMFGDNAFMCLGIRQRRKFAA